MYVMQLLLISDRYLLVKPNRILDEKLNPTFKMFYLNLSLKKLVQHMNYENS